MALLSATAPAKTRFSLLCHEESQHPHALWAPQCCGKRERARARVAAAAAMRPTDTAVAQTAAASSGGAAGTGRPRVLVAGGGIGGLVLALAARKKGYEVTVFERDMSAVRGEGQYRGPIQIQSNALAALEAIDMAVAEEVMREGCVTGDRINGLVDGVSGSWYIKFDTFTPAAERGLPVTRVISRMTLQQILARAVGDDAILNDSHVVDFIDDGNKVTAILEDGRKFEGDLLVGADGIWSKVRKVLFGQTEATYSDYTCYTGIANFVPPDIDTVGYRVFLGHKQYFVSSDVGAGKMQWYAFHKEPAGGIDPENGKRKRLSEIFSGWCDNVIDLINATDEEAILRRDIYDRPPTMNWGKGRVTLLGDSVHAMQPNLGQGGCMAIEDGYQLAVELEKAWQESAKSGTPMDIVSSLRSYEKERRLRVAVIHGLARMAAIMATTYRPYLGVGLGPLSFLTKLKIPHPGRVGGRFFIKYGMPLMLSWVLGGNSSRLEGRPLSCRLSDKANDQLRRWFEDDDALEQAMGGEYYFGTTISEDGDVSLGGQVVPKKDTFRYLGSMLQRDGDIDEDVSHRIKAGWMKWRQASGVLCDKRVPQKLKGKFYKTAIRPAMLYGAECWPTKRRHIQQLCVTEMRMLRWICGHTRLDRVRNDDIRDRLGVAPIEEKLMQHRLRWFGHVHRRPPEAPVHRGIIRRVNNVKRGRGRPNLTWEEAIKRDLKEWNIPKELCLDRSAWKEAIHVPEP